MDEIKKSILLQILKLDENIGLDKRLITNNTEFLEKELKKRKNRKKLAVAGLITLLAFIITLPLFNYYSCLKLNEVYSAMSNFFIVFTIGGYGFISNLDKIIKNLETKIFLLKLVRSLNELK
jgi:hypothetical protein